MSSRSGIYKIVCSAHGKTYVGSAINLKKRWDTHTNELKAGKHRNGRLQNAWNKYGADSFVFSVIEYVEDPGRLLAREQHWIDTLQVTTAGYNIAPTAGSQLGFKHSEKSRKQMAASQTGMKRAAEAIEKTASFLRGRPKTPEHAAKVGAAHKGKTISEQHRRQMSEARLGKKLKPWSDEAKAAHSVRMTGVPRVSTGWTDERRAKMSERLTGQTIPPEVVARRLASFKATMAARKASQE